MKYIVARIHNNSLGRVIEVSSEDEGKDLLKELINDQFGRGPTDEEVDQIEDYLEVYNEEDADNIFCFSIGVIG